MNILPYEYEIRIIGLAILGLLVIYCIKKKRTYAAGILLGFGWFEYFTTNLGFVLDVGKLFGIVCLGFIAFNPAILKTEGSKLLKQKWAPYYIYCVAITVLFAPAWPDQAGGAEGVLYTSLRWFVQIINLTLGFCIAIMIASVATSPKRLAVATKVMMVAAFILVSVGIYQYIAWKVGLPVNTIARQGGIQSTIAATMIGEQQTFRIYALAGEPKGFATSMCIPLVLLLLYGTRREVNPLPKYCRIPVTLAFIVCLYLTLSTAGFVIVAIALLAAVIAQIYVKVEYRTGLYSVGSLVALVLVAAIIFDSDGLVEKIQSTYTERIESRLSSSEERFTYGEKGVFSMWADSPQSIVLGVGMGGSSFYIRNYRDDYEGYTASARGIVGVLADIGILGVLLMYVPLISLIISTGARLRDHPYGARYIIVYIICCCGVTLMLTRAAWFFPYAVLGLLCAINVTLKRHDKKILAERKKRQNLKVAQKKKAMANLSSPVSGHRP